jgi:hypothetical protein
VYSWKKLNSLDNTDSKIPVKLGAIYDTSECEEALADWVFLALILSTDSNPVALSTPS